MYTDESNLVRVDSQRKNKHKGDIMASTLVVVLVVALSLGSVQLSVTP